jgi:phosphohistidine phosphatase
MRLLIIRHAIAVARSTPDIPDEERPLTGRGKRRFQRAARGLARIVGRPDVLLTSPLVRASKTARIAARAWGRVEPIEEPALAGDDTEAVLAAVVAHAQETGDAEDALVAVVGHEPHLSGLLARLIGASDADRVAFRKGGAALVELSGAPREGGQLIWFLPPRLLRALAEA